MSERRKVRWSQLGSPDHAGKYRYGRGHIDIPADAVELVHYIGDDPVVEIELWSRTGEDTWVICRFDMEQSRHHGPQSR